MDIIYRYDPSLSGNPPKYATAAEAIQVLREGNIRQGMVVDQVRGEILHGGTRRPIIVPSHPLSLGISLEAGQAPAQAPFGIVLGCSDARAPIELVFDHSHNELFVVRVAGNVLGSECLGSIEYAALHFADSLRLVVVLGHSGCGAVGAAVNLYLDPDAYGSIAVTHSLRTIVDRILVAVRVADKALERRCGPGLAGDPGYKAALGQLAVFLNAALTARDLARELDESVDNKLEVVYGVYDLATHRVEAAPRHDQTFAQAPKTSADFTELSDRLAESVLALGLLESRAV